MWIHRSCIQDPAGVLILEKPLSSWIKTSQHSLVCAGKWSQHCLLASLRCQTRWSALSAVVEETWAKRTLSRHYCKDSDSGNNCSCGSPGSRTVMHRWDTVLNQLFPEPAQGSLWSCRSKKHGECCRSRHPWETQRRQLEDGKLYGNQPMNYIVHLLGYKIRIHIVIYSIGWSYQR